MQSLHRRHFVALVAGSAAAGLAATYGQRAYAVAQAPQATGGKAAKPLKILILGGTAFIGPEFVEVATGRGHTITLFNRGKTRPSLFPDIEKLRGDRDPKKDEGLKSIEEAIKAGRTWDVVVDNSGYYPRHVKASAELLAPACKHYIFVSSISAFKEGAPANSDESYPVATLDDPAVEDMKGGLFYGGLKALCEAAAEAAMPGRVANIRPGFIVGPGDWTGRFSHWPLRARQGGEMIAPGTPKDPVQWIDVRDLAEWLVLCAERTVTGVYIATGPRVGETNHGTMGDIIETSLKVAKETASPAGSVDTSATWIDAEFLMASNVSPGGDLPIWIPPSGEMAGFHQWNVAKASAAGLRFRKVEDTIRGIYTWIDGLSADERKAVRNPGINREREATVLAAWKKAQSEKAEGEKSKGETTGQKKSEPAKG